MIPRIMGLRGILMHEAYPAETDYWTGMTLLMREDVGSGSSRHESSYMVR